MSVGKTILAANPKTQIILAVTAFVVLLFVVWGIYKLIHSRKEAADEKKALALGEFSSWCSQSGFDNHLRQYVIENHTTLTGKKLQTIKKDQALNLLHEIYDAKGILNDNEGIAVSGYKKIPSLADLLILSKVLTSNKGTFGTSSTDIITFAQSYLDDSDLALIFDSLNSKPQFIFS